MKAFLLSTLALALASLAGCQSSSVAQASGDRTLELAGAQSRYTIVTPANQEAAAASTPYALQGTQSDSFTVPYGTGYQAR